MKALSLKLLAAGLVILQGPSRLTSAECSQNPELSYQLSPDDEKYLEDFGKALGRFRGMNIEAFRDQYGPAKEYLDGSSRFVRGEATGDGVIDVSDAICILSHLFLGEGRCSRLACEDSADVDDSGVLEITDPLFLLEFLFLGGDPPSSPFPLRGLDRREDGLACSGARLLDDYDPLRSEYLNMIRGAYPFSQDQELAFRENGFVVLKDKKHLNFLQAFDQVYRGDLPIYISVDSMLDALHLSFDRILINLEEALLSKKLDQMLTKMDQGLALLEAGYGEEDLSEALDDVAIWIAAARSLLRGEPVTARRGMEARVEEFLGHVASERIQWVELFGLSWKEDFSQFKPRGHYTRSEALQRYFRSMMWVQRIGMNFVRCPRSAAVAYLLTQDLHQTGAIEEWRFINDVVEMMVGISDSLNPPALKELAELTGVESARDLLDPARHSAFASKALQTGAGMQRINSQILGSNPYTPERFTPIPPAFHLMGQRFIVDSFIFTNVVHDRVPERYMPSPLDAWFVLGNRAALPLLRGELEVHGYHPHLAALDWIVGGYPEEFWNRNLYHLWLSTLRTLQADTTSSRYPAVMRTPQWDLRILNTQLASWAHLRHDTILYAKPSFTGNGCHYPDGWVDPYPEFFAKLSDFSARALAGFGALGLLAIEDPPQDSDPPEPLLTFSGSRVGRYFESLNRHCRSLKEIAESELEEKDLTAEQTAFVKSLVQNHSTYTGVRYTGWYAELVFANESWIHPEFGQMRYDLGFDPTIADVHTFLGRDPLSGRVLHIGVGHPNFMVISVKNECGTKAYVGPVLSYHEFILGDLQRMTDEEWRALLDSGEEPGRPDWTQSFAR